MAAPAVLYNRFGNGCAMCEPEQTTQAVPSVAERMDPRLLELLVCPVTKGPLSYDAGAQELISRKAMLAFPIKSGVPLMTVDAARHLDSPKPAGKG
jgi:uncharacterized protein